MIARRQDSRHYEIIVSPDELVSLRGGALEGELQNADGSNSGKGIKLRYAREERFCVSFIPRGKTRFEEARQVSVSISGDQYDPLKTTGSHTDRFGDLSVNLQVA